MISQETFNRIEIEHGCGYWNLCWEHACPCAITTENKGLQESIYNGMCEENRLIAKESDIEYASTEDDSYEEDNYEDDTNDDLGILEDELEGDSGWDVCEKCGEEIDIITASRYGNKCQECYVGIK